MVTRYRIEIGRHSIEYQADPKGDLVPFTEHEAALKAKDEQIAGLKKSLQYAQDGIRLISAAFEKDYLALLDQAIRLAGWCDLLSNSSLRVGELTSETHAWPVHVHLGGLHNECIGTIAEFRIENLAHAFVQHHCEAQAFLSRPDVQARRKEQYEQ